jgi:aspartate kinase
MIPLVMKFGGASVKTAQNITQIAHLICERARAVKKLVVVVSAMGNTTDQLLALAREIHPTPPRREQDMLLSVGERISMALLAMALSVQGREAISFTGSQSGIITNEDHAEAKIVAVRPTRLLQALDAGAIVIVAGFQGVSRQGEITTLGRGGSDTTAVALAVALGAEIVEFYKDVGGIFDRDPKIDRRARLLPQLSYQETYALVQQGAKVLHPRAIALAEKNGIQLHIVPGTVVGMSAQRNAHYYFEES